MRTLIVSVCLLCVGCSQGYTHFDHPIVDERGYRVDPSLVGRWAVELEPEAGDEAERIPDVSISPDGEVTFEMPPGEPGKDLKLERLRLVTARIGNDTFASLQTGESGHDTWAYFRYWMPEPGVVSYASDSTRFWKDAVRNKMVSGVIETTSTGEGTTVTASEAELRAFVLGYGRVIFADEELGRLRRLK